MLNLPFPILRCLDVLSEIERWGKRLSLFSRFMEGTATQTQNKQIKEAESLCGWIKKTRDQRALSLALRLSLLVCSHVWLVVAELFSKQEAKY